MPPKAAMKPKKKDAIAIATPTGISKGLMARIVELAKKQVELEKHLEKNAEDRKQLNKDFEKIAGGFQAEGELPLAMQEAEITELVLEDGNRIILDKELKIPSLAGGSKHLPTVIKWLKDSGHQDLIKSELTAQFTMDKDDLRLPEAIKALEKLKVPFSNYESANANSFKALVNELLENGEDVPIGELGIMEFKQTEIKAKKVKE